MVYSFNVKRTISSGLRTPNCNLFTVLRGAEESDNGTAMSNTWVSNICQISISGFLLNASYKTLYFILNNLLIRLTIQPFDASIIYYHYNLLYNNNSSIIIKY